MIPNSRYDGKPLLRLLELYVLNSINELSQVDRQTLERMEPRLHAIYGGGGTWHEAIAAALSMSLDVPKVIQDMWISNQETAKKKGVILSPQMFAEMFVDQNFTV
ncbi:hypothetical protein [Gluconacetobacter asukensis]|uniref:Uncharacterized protein n=1 Tax=Gluconacetobacter asukensis TaxID=1017181 RepID=A0A7W4J356_9PROT|nr:hypothetical protein [Gluconacetobacter asukensis]MBB2173836.1 hypothetical protein [Gluconacetobacter asukensis]